jgi:hypothetical protein
MDLKSNAEGGSKFQPMVELGNPGTGIKIQ